MFAIRSISGPVMLSLIAAACGSSLSGQPDGGTGTAGTGGTAGVTGVGGTSAPAGTLGTAGTGGTGTGGTSTDAGDASPPFDAGAPACTQVVQSPGPSAFGFDGARVDYGTSFTAVVTTVAADHLVVQRAGGESLTFGWSGPSLATEFSVNENVSCERTLQAWNIVKGTRRTAEIHVDFSNTGISQSGAIPGGGNYMLEPECATVSTSPCPGGGPVVQMHYRLLVSLASDSVVIPMKTTATLGDLQITNVFHEQGWGGGSLGSTCHIDFSNLGMMSVLGPP